MTDATPIYLSIDDWVHLAAEILQIDPATISRIANLALADSALHAPEPGSPAMTPTTTSSTRPLCWAGT